MNKEILSESKIVSGWGLYKKVKVNLISNYDIKSLQEFIKKAPPGTVITRGIGRSYGDAAQLKDEYVVNLSNFNTIQLDLKRGLVLAGAGVNMETLLKEIVPKGFFIPVSAGTRRITVGGAIASDIHGKNHHVDGSFGNHLKKIKLIDGNGKLNELTLKNNPEEFWATVGGMGHTGIIIEATFSLIPIQSSFMKVDTFKFEDLDSLMDCMIDSDKKYRYSVAWIDSLNKKGRGVLTCGEHANFEDLNEKQKINPLNFDFKSIAKSPQLPKGILNKYTVKAFNEFWFRKSHNHKTDEIQSLSSFFHPLDNIDNWNLIYGPSGFIQYQFVVPNSASNLIGETLFELRKIGAPSFLTVLKRFGENNNSYLSFPIAGWTLAADIPIKLPGLFPLLSNLDRKIMKAGGRIYLAKDSRQTKEMFLASYPRFKEWDLIRNKMDPRKIFKSDLSERIGMY